jgi:hypothetical protein
MKKPKGNKKNKVKKKWSKQCGHFTFKNIRFGPNGDIRIGVFFKDEEFGFLNCITSKSSDSYSCNIYGFDAHVYLGKAQCYGNIHQLPKKIDSVILNVEIEFSVLCPERKVITEKFITLDFTILRKTIQRFQTPNYIMVAT